MRRDRRQDDDDRAVRRLASCTTADKRGIRCHGRDGDTALLKFFPYETERVLFALDASTPSRMAPTGCGRIDRSRPRSTRRRIGIAAVYVDERAAEHARRGPRFAPHLGWDEA